MDDKWSVSVAQGLSAFFKQPNGVSRSGTDWMVILARGTEQRKLLVRTYGQGDEQGSREQASRAASYVTTLLDSGWNPNSYEGKPGELTVPSDAATNQTGEVASKPWWKFW